MGYRIQYSDTVKRRTFYERDQSNVKLILFVSALCLCFVFVFVAVQYRNTIWRWILPGDPEITQAAITAFEKNIRSGVSVGEAINVFCKEILEGAMY